jgi:hypothetical protein
MTWRPNKAEAPAATYRQEPAGHYTSVETEVTIPVLQALVVALAWAVLAGLLVGGLAYWRGWAWWLVPAVMIAVIAVLFAWRVTVHVGEHRKRLWRREVSEGRDIDGDGAIGRPQPIAAGAEDPRFVFVRDPAREKRRQAAEDFHLFLREAYSERGTTWRRWDGFQLPSGRKVTQPIWENYCNRLLQAGLAERPFATGELELTSDYRSALQTFREVL